MDIIQKEHNVHFIYDSKVDLNTQYKGRSLHNMKLAECLDVLFKNSGIEWNLNGSNISLKKVKLKKTEPTKKKYTISGYVRDVNDESIISASIYDKSTGEVQ